MRRTTSARPASRTSISSRIKSIPATRYIFFGGKGGVGKTTAAAATALLLLDRAKNDEKILLLSTDPAHSLSDSLQTRVGNRLRTVARNNDARLIALEMDSGAALERFRSAHSATLAEIADRGTLLDKSDIDELLNLSLPGIDEVMALFELSELDRESEYSKIIVDTAPSGHTSRLLRMPEVFAQMIRALDRMADKHRYIVAQFARRRPIADEVDRFLIDLSKRIEHLRAVLFEPAQTSFVLVTIPEMMSVDETKRYFSTLRQENVPVTDLIINRVEHEHGGCKHCRARVASQSDSLKKLKDEFRALRIHNVPLLPDEVNGVEALRNFADLMWASAREQKAEGGKQKAEGGRQEAEAGRSDRILPSAFRLLVFGGKGGVGKTTAAAAAALAVADANPDERVLVFSTDPAHSLSDSFDEPVGAFKRGVAGLENLDAMEIDPSAWFEDLKHRYKKWTDDLFSSIAGDSRWEIKFDREAMREVVSLTPPGIDEIAALSAISDLLEQNRYTKIILDTAPTGHLVRFLELPAVALSWIRTFIKLLLKYRNVVRSGSVAEELISLSKNVKKLIALMSDRRRCEFIGVAIPEQMSFEETARLAPVLKRLKTPMRRLLINGLVPAEAGEDCRFCNSRRRSQQKVLGDFRRKFGRSCELIVAPQRPNEVRGASRLREHFNKWQLLTPRKARESLR